MRHARHLSWPLNFLRLVLLLLITASAMNSSNTTAQEILRPIKVATEVHSKHASGTSPFTPGICRAGTRTINEERSSPTTTTLLGFVLDFDSGTTFQRWCEDRSGVHSLVYFEVHTFLSDRPRDLPRRFSRVMLSFEGRQAPDTVTEGRGADKFPIQSVQASTSGWAPGFRTYDARTARLNVRSIGHDNLDFAIRQRRISLDVTNVVREWMDGRQVNHGFRILPRMPRGSKLNAMNVRRLFNIQLEFFF